MAELLLLLAGDAKNNSPVQWHGFQLDVEAAAVIVRPRRPYAGPEGFLSLALAYLVRDVAWRLCGLGFAIRFVIHLTFPFAFAF